MPYRSTDEALRERVEHLTAELDALRARRAEAATLEAEAARLREALAKTLALLERLEGRRVAPVLDDVRIAAPCSAKWAEMSGDERSRFCGACQKHVYNLSAMTREEAELLILEKEGNLCARIFRRADGTVLTQDCPVGVRRRRLRVVGALALGGGLVATAAGLVAGRTGASGPDRGVVGKLEMGDISPAATTPRVERALPPHVVPPKR